MTLVEISNQHFYNDPKIKICRRPCVIDRSTVPIEVPSERVWNRFCDEVDLALEFVNDAKQVARRSLFPSACLILIIFVLAVGPAFVDYDFVYRKYVCFTIVGLLTIHHIYAYCSARSLCVDAFGDVSQVCERFSDQDTKYRLSALKKRHLRFKTAFVHKQYFISINSREDDGLTFAKMEEGRASVDKAIPIRIKLRTRRQHASPEPSAPLAPFATPTSVFAEVAVPWAREAVDKTEDIAKIKSLTSQEGADAPNGNVGVLNTSTEAVETTWIGLNEACEKEDDLNSEELEPKLTEGLHLDVPTGIGGDLNSEALEPEWK
mmetsp:Transcript_5254/g.8042  ORF Transcript_5254/g.8042 Transcript_5254/m.8042 type:complete len:320 (+) Transcript_5254:207-1166(+)